jgi:hypothetical protein
MAKILKTMLILLLCIVGVQDLFAKTSTKKLKLNEFIQYEGEVQDNTPYGQGALTYKDGLRVGFLYIFGNFDGNKVSNATLSLGNISFKGDLEYKTTEDKQAKKATLSITLLDGWANPSKVTTEMIPYVVCSNINIRIDSKVKLGINCNYSNKRNIGVSYSCTNQRYTFEVSECPYSLRNLKDVIDSSEMTAAWIYTSSGIDLTAKWASSTLTSGIKVLSDDYEPKLSYPDYMNNYNDFSITMSDKGVLKANKGFNKYVLTCPNGDVMEGEFSKPSYTKKSGNELLAAIVKSRVSDYVFKTGKITHSDGNIEIYKDGVLISSSKVYQNNPYISKLPKYNDVIQGKRLMGYCDAATHDFQRACVNDVYSFAGKQNMDELDRKIYEQSDDYKQKNQELNKLRETDFYCLFSVATEFTTTSIKLWGKSAPHVAEYCHIPDVRSDSNEGNSIVLNESDIEILKLIKAAKKNLQVLVVLKPDFEYNGGYYGKPSALYLVDSEAKTILYDFSSHITTTSKARLLAEEKRREAKSEAEWRARQKKIRHHSTPKKITCTVCFGRGYVIDSNQVRSRCWNCYGYGYTETYDY